MEYATLFTDKDGESHFRDATVGFELVNFAPPAPPVGSFRFYGSKQNGLF